MKKLLLLLITVLSFSAQAQVKRIDTINSSSINLKGADYKTHQLYSYSIGIKAFGMEEFPKILNQVNSSEFLKPIASGLFIKFNDNQISYRISANYYSDDEYKFRNECEECEEAKGKLKDFSAKVGFEKSFIYGVVQPYFAFDIGYRRNTFKGQLSSLTAPGSTSDVTTLKNGFLMSPNFGVKFNPLDRVTVSVEAGIGVLYSYEKQDRTFNDASRTRTNSQYKKWEFLLKPVSLLGVQYNFGSSY